MKLRARLSPSRHLTSADISKTGQQTGFVIGAVSKYLRRYEHGDTLLQPCFYRSGDLLHQSSMALRIEHGAF